MSTELPPDMPDGRLPSGEPRRGKESSSGANVALNIGIGCLVIVVVGFGLIVGFCGMR